MAHNYYLLLLLPLLTALVDRAIGQSAPPPGAWKLVLVLAIFGFTDLLARLPGMGSWLRDLGLPLISLALLMFAGARVLLCPQSESVAAATQQSDGMSRKIAS